MREYVINMQGGGMYLLLLLGNEQVIHYQIYNKGKKYGYSSYVVFFLASLPGTATMNNGAIAAKAFWLFLLKIPQSPSLLFKVEGKSAVMAVKGEKRLK